MTVTPRRSTSVTSGSTGNGTTVNRTAPKTDNNVSERPIAPRKDGYGSSTGVTNVPPRGNNVNDGGPKPVRPQDVNRPRPHPRDRDFVDFDHRPPHRFYEPHHHHCFGYRVHALPHGCVYHDWYGVRYWFYDDIYYRYYDGYYVVCRPPFGTVVAASIAADIAWTAIRIDYYNTVNYTYNTINENNKYIAEQNETIAKNNAIIAQQNETLAAQAQAMSQRSDEAYRLATAMGLIQSYASAQAEYYYQDGVFYAKNANGEYYTIVAPAGAVVDSLPDDYDAFTFNGKEYYKVDNTVYRIVISDGKPYFEVLGQMVA